MNLAGFTRMMDAPAPRGCKVLRFITYVEMPDGLDPVQQVTR
ncbi:MAG: hypothetical protein JWN52_7151 [Actinomycetia bacterium]|jgi:hypothetical protein|nr:hypothetical protein [Actinomycetes bacterium]